MSGDVEQLCEAEHHRSHWFRRCTDGDCCGAERRRANRESGQEERIQSFERLVHGAAKHGAGVLRAQVIFREHVPSHLEAHPDPGRILVGVAIEERCVVPRRLRQDEVQVDIGSVLRMSDRDIRDRVSCTFEGGARHRKQPRDFVVKLVEEIW